MVYVREISPPVSFSGVSSFKVSFQYKPEIVDAIKTVPLWRYDKRDFSWEVPNCCAAELLDALSLVDDVSFCPLPDETGSFSDPPAQPPLTEAEIGRFRFRPYAHQVEGVDYGLAKGKWLLLDNPGCGKTNQIIGLAETLKRRGEASHCLVICGINSLKSNWAKEIRKFSTESAVVIGEKRKRDGTIGKTPMSIAERVEQLRKPISEFFVILNVESLRDDKIVKALTDSKSPNKFEMIAIDEVHRCLASGKSSVQGSNILKLRAKYQVAATGTLLLNNPLNC